MGRGNSLTEDENGIIRAFTDCVLSERKIDLKRNTFKAVGHNFLYAPRNYLRNERSGWKSNLSARCKRNIIRLVVQDCGYSFNTTLALSVTSRNVIEVLKSVKCLKYSKFKCKTKLQNHHIYARLTFVMS